MRLPTPKFTHPPEIYAAISREYRNDNIRMGEYLRACGWTLADAGWAAAKWDLCTLAAAIANERVARNVNPTTLSEAEVAKIKAELGAAKKSTANPRPKITTRIVRTMPKLTLRPPRKPGEPRS